MVLSVESVCWDMKGSRVDGFTFQVNILINYHDTAGCGILEEELADIQ